MDDPSAPRDPRLLHVVLLGLSVAGLAACITMMYLGMRAVMDIGGACAEGGPYVPVQPCPDGAPLALILGSFGLFGFGALVFGLGAAVGGWAWLAILAWTGLFAALGWNFLDYGVFNPPDGEIVWGWLIPGVMFEVMAFAPLLFLGGLRGAIAPARGLGEPSRAARPQVNVLSGPGQARRPSPWTPASMGAVASDAAAGTFPEGTQALLDRLERLADMRAQGLLDEAEYETAKDAVLRELEARRR